MPYVVPDAVREPLYAIVPYFNPWRWKSREKHTARAIKHFADSGAIVVLVEAAFNRREFTWSGSTVAELLADCKIAPGLKHIYVPVRTKDELWLKENLINIGVAHLPPNWQQVCWLDSDIHFVRPNWVGECIHKLQHYKFLQMFSHARDIGPNSELLPHDHPHADGVSFVRFWKDGGFSPDNPDVKKNGTNYYGFGIWPGLAWACTREAWDIVGGLFDVAIWGGGDYDMAHALIEQATQRTHKGVHPNYRTMLSEWEDRCRRGIRRNVGVMEGTVLHAFHGKKTDRKYVEKRKLMRKVKFDPLRHLKRDYQGVWQLHDDGSEDFIHFRDEMRKIAKARNEDGNEV